MSDLPILADVDVVVVGGGPAGTAAGIAVARAGARTLILERNGFLGGNLTAAGIDTMYGVYTVADEPVKVIGGVIDEVVARLEIHNACYERRNTYGAGTGITVDLEELKLALEDLALESGAKVLYHAFVPDVILEDGQLCGVVTASKNGLQQVRARYFIDCSGDADLVARAGGAVELPGEVGPVQSCTTVFFMGNVDLEAYKSFGKQKMWEAMERAKASGEFNLPRVEGSFHATPERSLIEANMTRIRNVNTIDLESLTDAEIEGRKQVQEYVHFLKKYVPGFQNGYLVKTGSHIGVREGRRTIGEYVLTRQDVLEGRRFPDAVVRCGQPIEDHHAGSDTEWGYVKDRGFYDIPYRSLLPLHLDNLLVAGRCLSATHDAHASARSSATAMAMGQAAGLAASLALREQNACRKIDTVELQDKLRHMGALI